MNDYIDTHAHLWSEEYLDFLNTLGAKGTDVAKNIRQSDSEEDLKHRFNNMDKAGVKLQILSATPQSPQWGSKEQAKKSAGMINSLYEKLVKKYPERFKAYGAVSLPYLDLAVSQAKSILKNDSFIGIAVPTLVRDEISIADEKFEKFFEVLNQYKANVYIHPTGCGANSPMINDFELEWVVGAPIEAMLSTLQLLKRDIPKRYPNIKFHISHLGGAIPFLMTRIEDNYEDWDSFNDSPTEMLKKHFTFDTANFKKESLLSSIETFGIDKFMLGSDFPYFQDKKYIRAVEYIKNSGIDTEKIEAVLSKNAIKFYEL